MSIEKKGNKKKLSLFRVTLIVVVILFIGNFINTYRADQVGDRTHVLVFGVDDPDGNSGARTRADTIMVLSLDPKMNNPLLLSIPRDTRVNIPGRKSMDKINHAHAYGGRELLVSTVEGLLEIEIDYYLRLNYEAVREVVDTLGGIEVDVAVDMKYEDPYDDPPLSINIPKGNQVLDGINAMHFLRFRSGYASQDLGRIQAQQQFVQALIKEGLAPWNLIKTPKLLSVFFQHVDTNLTMGKILTMGVNSINLDTDNMTKITLPGTPKMINRVSYIVVDENELKEIKKDYLLNSESVSSQIVIEVLNGCGVSGTAGKFAEVIQGHGYAVEGIGNYDNGNVENSFIEYSSQSKKEVNVLAKKLGISQLIEVDGETNTANVRVIIGSDLVN
ncbi:cell envelope-related transcriptional attenuator [Alkaliphilus metalliredigens QYMF]|uniref:Cell envelope-related transcriptional attenuator n=1 Tax=Alkaliphilus metalliredigens (strain QYMF) TaxID=293826 RepID=A6TQK0_ALKMQ|nr:LCP family protein [Alkaliphilus metalliredigens]ABR48468.1 cell envelope-related transcriptional attenuator [Alkaliphilus metalliredigens QYMF]